MEQNGRNYLVRSDALPGIAALAAKKDLTEKVWERATASRKPSDLLTEDGLLRYVPTYVSWLDAQGRKKRRKRFSAQATGTMKLSQLLRAVGRHLDRLEPHAFNISWSRDGVVIDYELADGQRISESLSKEKLRELTIRMRLQRSRRR